MLYWYWRIQQFNDYITKAMQFPMINNRFRYFTCQFLNVMLLPYHIWVEKYIFSSSVTTYVVHGMWNISSFYRQSFSHLLHLQKKIKRNLQSLSFGRVHIINQLIAKQIFYSIAKHCYTFIWYFNLFNICLFSSDNNLAKFKYYKWNSMNNQISWA